MLHYLYNNNYVNDTKFPVEATKYIKENYDINNIKIYNEYFYGSYLLFNDIKVFIDSRADLYLKEFNDTSVFEDAMYIDINMKDLLDKYDINLVIASNKGKNHELIELNNKFKNVYKDDYFSIYERSQAKTRMKHFGFHLMKYMINYHMIA